MDEESDTRWERIKAILAKLHGVDPDDQALLLDEMCGGDPELRAHVEQLLENYSSALKFFARFPDLVSAASDPRSVTRTFSDGQVVSNRFRITGLLGQGGMGEVYEAEDLVLRHEHIALKTLRATLAADESAIERLSRELQLARRITHPNVCRVHDVYQHQTSSGGRILYFTMELLKGDTLADRLRNGTIDTAHALPVVKQMAEALGAAHRANVAHGDFKPGNIMLVASEAGGERAVVTDFGLARWLPVGSVLLTTSLDSRPWGTPAYMAPEQILNGEVTRATDIYALGVVLYEMVTGHQPFAIDAPFLLAVRKLRQAPHPPREYVDNLDSRWQAVILRCLDVNPEKRFQNATDIVKQLEPSRRRISWWMASAAALGCAGALGLPQVREKVVETSASLSTAVARRFGGERSVAVLPFSHENRTSEDKAFSLGVTAAVTDRLGALSHDRRGFYVIPAPEVIDTGVETPALVRQTLGADSIVTGHLVQLNGQFRIDIAWHEMSGGVFAVKDRRVVEISVSDPEPLEDRLATAIAQLLRVSPPLATLEHSGERTPLAKAEKSYLLGRGYLLQGPGGVASAIASFQHAIQENDRYAVAYAGLSEAYLGNYMATNDVESVKHALMNIDEAIKLEPIDARSHVIRGRVYLTTGQHTRAISEFQRALGIDPTIVGVRNQLAAADAAEGATEIAEKEYRAAIAMHPGYWSAYEDLGTFLYRQGRFAEAEQNYVVGSTYAPANRRTIANLAAVYEIQERFQAAEIELTKGLKLSPDANLYNNLGWIYILDGKLEEAVRTLREAVKLPLADSLVWSSLARACRWAGTHPEDQRAAYQTALERANEELRVNPLSAETRANRAYLLVETHRTSEALREIKATLETANARGSVSVLFRSALIHELAGDRKGALDALESAARGGYPRSRIARDPDLERLRHDPGYERVLDMAGRGANKRF
jgi:serine/threonine protein kinase/Flp pilus assembly protein TadD/TolB-like protein